MMTLKNIKRRTLRLNLQLIRAESVPRAVASEASASSLLRKPRSLPLAVLIRRSIAQLTYQCREQYTLARSQNPSPAYNPNSQDLSLADLYHLPGKIVAEATNTEAVGEFGLISYRVEKAKGSKCYRVIVTGSSFRAGNNTAITNAIAGYSAGSWRLSHEAPQKFRESQIETHQNSGVARMGSNVAGALIRARAAI